MGPRATSLLLGHSADCKWLWLSSQWSMRSCGIAVAACRCYVCFCQILEVALLHYEMIFHTDLGHVWGFLRKPSRSETHLDRLWIWRSSIQKRLSSLWICWGKSIEYCLLNAVSLKCCCCTINAVVLNVLFELFSILIKNKKCVSKEHSNFWGK